ncbi:MAG: hypothetical protein IPI45_13030 [Saprospiraceae bacterium]|nr:hypothetical protein [Saprospiraceae bacterium]MBK7738690.1 hypothetical protein [Saprospiraceae bacterium]MBK7912738.1 hypothetical protein [Saprospiraceae bacterium]
MRRNATNARMEDEWRKCHECTNGRRMEEMPRMHEWKTNGGNATNTRMNTRMNTRKNATN